MNKQYIHHRHLFVNYEQLHQYRAKLLQIINTQGMKKNLRTISFYTAYSQSELKDRINTQIVTYWPKEQYVLVVKKMINAHK